MDQDAARAERPEASQNAEASAGFGADARARNAEVLSIVAHDIRGPLGVILVAISELGDARVGALTDGQRSLVQLVRRSCERLGRLAANVAFLEKMSMSDGGAISVSSSALDLRDVARRAVESFEKSGETGKRIRLALHVPDDRLGIHGEADLLVQACANVIANAVRVARAEIVVTVASDDGANSVVIEDDGPGFSPELLPSLFESRRSAGERDARGLGLPIVKAIVDAHGASITAGPRLQPTGESKGARVRIAFRPQL